jgi:membrane-associated protease RseP (regulator of RpoE activity)
MTMSHQRPSSNPWLELWKTTVSGAVAICAITSCSGLIFASLAFARGGAEITGPGLHISLAPKTQTFEAPPLPSLLPPQVEELPAPVALTSAAPLAIPYLGIRYQNDIQEVATGAGRVELRCARVHEVTPGSPAAAVGLLPNDVILAADGRPLLESYSLQEAVRGSRVGATMTLHVHRSGETLRLLATLGELPLGIE